MMNHIHDSFIALNGALTGLLQAIPEAILVRCDAGRCRAVNKAAETLLKLHGQAHQDPPSGFDCQNCVFRDACPDDKAVWDAGSPLVVEKCLVDAAGSARDYQLHKAPVFKADGKRQGFMITVRDMTDIKLAERNLRVADAAIESQEAIVISDADNKIQRVNRSFTRMTGYSAEEAVGKTTALLKSGLHDKAFYQAMWQALAENKYWQGEIWDRRKNGQIYPKWLTITAVAGPDGKVHNYVGAFTDLSEHKEAKEAIYQLAFYDSLTSLPNRRLLHDRMDLALSNCSRSLHYGAVMMIDLDNFKIINDTKGHAMGDLLLVEMAKRLKSCVRDGDTVARLGGDEFVVMIELLSKDASQAAQQAEVLSKKILKVGSQPFLVAGEELRCSLSIGISMFTIPNSTSEEMLKRADVAMYQAKSAGRNTMCFFDPNVQASLEKRLAIISELYQALPENQFKLFYQAQVDRKLKVQGVEALLRWQHPQRGLVSPDAFISIAEESGLIVPIGLWVILEACTQLKIWEKSPLTQHLSIAVNVSPKQFNQPDFVEQVCMVLDETGANPALLKIELTESLVLHDVADTIAKMEALKLQGVSFSIDDFGTGYSSLSYLKRLPISQLKIDRSFVREIDTNQSDANIARTIIDMANNFGFNVIAEGVETEAQRTCLENHGCLMYQGYLFSRPVPLEEFEALMASADGY